MFGRKSRAERLKEQAESSRLIPVATLAAGYAGARPVIERLLYDDDLRDNIRVFIESARKISDELSGEDPGEIVTRLWDDDKLRKQIEAGGLGRPAGQQAGARRAGAQRRQVAANSCSSSCSPPWASSSSTRGRARRPARSRGTPTAP